MHPLTADEGDVGLYVDWQQEIGADDIKRRITNPFARSRLQPIIRLFTGHRGVGKTTELYRVKTSLEAGVDGQRFFVSMLLAERWMDLEDVRPEEIVFQMVRQLVADLKAAGFELGAQRFGGFFGRLRDLLSREVNLEAVEIGADPLKFSFKFEDTAGARPQLRHLLRGQLPRIYDLVNQEVLVEARKWLSEPEHGKFNDVLVIVDQLDRMPRKTLNGQNMTNHENLFLNCAGILGRLQCHVLYTIPIELAYSRCRVRLGDVYGAEIISLPAIPVTDRQGRDHLAGQKALEQIVQRRAERAGVHLDEVFESAMLRKEVLQAAGGHVRGLLMLLRSMIDRINRDEDLPINRKTAELSLKKAAEDLALPLSRRDRLLLEQVHKSRQLPNGDANASDLLRELFVLAYEDEDGHWWCDRNPLLGYLSERPRP